MSPDFRATTRGDFARSARQNTRGTLDDLLILSGKNEAPNPDFDDPVPGDPLAVRGWTLGAPDNYDGYDVAVRQIAGYSLVAPLGARIPLRDTRFSVQNGAPVRMLDSYRQDGPLVSGADPRPATLPLYKPVRPAIQLVPNASVGYAAGWIGVEVRGVVGAFQGPNRLFTGPSARTTVQVSQGQSWRFFPGNVPVDGLKGLAIFATEPQATQAAALTAPTYHQRTLDLARALPASVPMIGPFRGATRGQAVNQTFLGSLRQNPAPSVRFRKGSRTLQVMDTRVSYQVRRRGNPGWAALSQSRALLVTAARPEEAACVYLPPGVAPKGAYEWRVVLETNTGQLFAFEPHTLDEETRIFSTDPEQYPEFRRPELLDADSAETDATGVLGPDSAPEDPEAFGSARPAPGEYSVRVQGTKNDSETGETKGGPLSDFVVVTLPESAPGSGVATHTFEVAPPDQNIAYNPRYVERDVDGTDRGWDRIIATGVTYEYPDAGQVIIQDRSDATTNATTRFPRWSWDIDPTIPYTLVVPLRMIDRTGGLARVSIQYRDANDALISSQALGDIQFVGRVRIHASVGPVGSGAAFETMPATTRKLRVVIVHEGAPAGTAPFPRNFRLWKGPMALVPGLAAPQLEEAEEDAGSERNPQGYCKRLSQAESDLVLPIELRNRGVRVIEYYAPLSTPPASEYGPRGLKVYVAPGVSYATSIYLYHLGVTRAMQGLVTAYKDAKGRVLKENAPLAPDRVGTLGWTRYQLTAVAPEGAAYLEVVSGGFSDGLVRVAAVQHEESTTAATAYDNTNPLSGSVAAILDTRIPGDAASTASLPVAVENPIVRLVRGGSVHTNTAVTTVDVAFASGDTAALADAAVMNADFTALARKRYLKIRDTLTTTDATQSPEVDALYVVAERRDPVLTREDGSEFPGGVKVGNLPPPDVEPRTTEEEMVSGETRVREMAPDRRWLRGLELLGFTKSMREEVSSYANRAKRAGVEGDGMRYIVEIPGEISWEYDREAHMPMIRPDGSTNPDGYYIFRATVDAEIVSEGPL